MSSFRHANLPPRADRAVFTDWLDAEMKPRLIFITNGDPPDHGEANFSGNQTQPAATDLPGGLGVQPRRGG